MSGRTIPIYSVVWVLILKRQTSWSSNHPTCTKSHMDRSPPNFCRSTRAAPARPTLLPYPIAKLTSRCFHLILSAITNQASPIHIVVRINEVHFVNVDLILSRAEKNLAPCMLNRGTQSCGRFCLIVMVEHAFWHESHHGTLLSRDQGSRGGVAQLVRAAES